MSPDTFASLTTSLSAMYKKQRQFDVPEIKKGDKTADQILFEVRTRQKKILIVDDEPLILSSLQRSLRKFNYKVICTEQPYHALQMMEAGLIPDVIITDQRMPSLSGSDLLSIVYRRWPDVVRLSMSGYAERAEMLSIINAGHVYRFLIKPWSVEELHDTIASAMHEADLLAENRALHQYIQEHNQQLNQHNHVLHDAVADRTIQLIETSERLDAALLDTVRALAYAVEAKDAYTAGHSDLVARFGVALADKIGLGEEDKQALHLGCILHDVGKIGVPDTVLLKPGKLTSEEFDLIKQHPVIGARILQDVHFPYDIMPIVRNHHERWDGKGYPDNLKADETPLLARLTHIVDVYEAITAYRVYRNPMSKDRILGLYESGIGTDFDPELTPVFLEMLHAGVFEQIRQEADVNIVQEACKFGFSEPRRNVSDD